MGNFNQLRETCFYKTGRDGVVLEFCDNLHPNIFKDNSYIENSIYDRYSKFKVTLVDKRKTDKGKAVYYNLDPDEVILIALLLSDGDCKLFKSRTGVFTSLNAQTQITIRQLVSTFQFLDWDRFSIKIKSSLSEANKQYKDNTMITLQKNFDTGNNKLSVRRIIISYEEGMRSSSKWKITIEEGFGVKEQGNGLNIVKNGTYKMENKSFLMLQEQELIVPIYEAAKRVFISQQAFYPIMKQAEKEFTAKKMETKDYSGERIDQWNKGALPKHKSRSNDTNQNNPQNIQNSNNTQNVPERKCSQCNEPISEAEYNYSMQKLKKPLCRKCQNTGNNNQQNLNNDSNNSNTDKKCSCCNKDISEAEHNYSMKKFKKPLCRACQSMENKKAS